MSYVRVVIIETIMKSVLFTHWCTCMYKIIVTYIFLVSNFIADSENSLIFFFFKYFYEKYNWGKHISYLLDDRNSYVDKYFHVLYSILWSLFGQSFGSQLEFNIPGKTISSVCMVIGCGFTIHLASKFY